MTAIFSAEVLFAALARSIDEPAAARYCVAFSGGLDSTALLHGLTILRRAHPTLVLRALHVNHHLLPGADAWSEHCRNIAAELHVPLQVLDASIATGRGISTEAAARDARYSLFEAELQEGEILLTAHHQDDQFETVLLQLFRGAGLPGLAAMPAAANLGRARHVRPLLGVSRAALQAYMAVAGLTWIDDSSNADERYDRNYLRHRVLPVIRERWPGAPNNVARSAAHFAAAQALLDGRAQDDLAIVREGSALRLSALRTLDMPRARNLLRYWIREAGFKVPSTVRLEEILRQMLAARVDAAPCVKWAGAEVRRYRDRLYVLAPLEQAPLQECVWDWRQQPSLSLGASGGTLELKTAADGEVSLARLPCPLFVAMRVGAAKLQLHAAGPHRTLRSVFQEHGIVPWMRDRIPLLSASAKSRRNLIAVGDRWIDAAYRARAAEPALALRWHHHPPLG